MNTEKLTPRQAKSILADATAQAQEYRALADNSTGRKRAQALARMRNRETIAARMMQIVAAVGNMTIP